MKPVFADTSYYSALLSPKDAVHEKRDSRRSSRSEIRDARELSSFGPPVPIRTSRADPCIILPP
jgi:hypothetical protein